MPKLKHTHRERDNKCKLDLWSVYISMIFCAISCTFCMRLNVQNLRAYKRRVIELLSARRAHLFSFTV